MSIKVQEVLPPIPDKLYFTIGETSDLCAIKPHVLRYWEQEFSQLKPTKRRGGRRYYQVKDIELIRQIRELLYLKGFTIAGAKQQMLADKLTEKPAVVKQPVIESKPAVKAPPIVQTKPVSQEILSTIIGELESLLVVLED